MNAKLKLLVAVMVFASLAYTVYTIKQKAMLEDQLSDNVKQCEGRIMDLSERLERELDKKQQEIDRRSIQQAGSDDLPGAEITPDAYEHVERQMLPAHDSFDESVGEIVERKYRFLLASLSLSPDDLESLRLLLHKREEIALKLKDAKNYSEELGLSEDDAWALEYELQDVDARIEGLLNGESSQRYVMLKDSDEEQKQFSEYALGVNGLFPLNNKQQEAVLLTRLKHKQYFEEKLKALGLDQDFPLTKEQSKKLVKDLEMEVMRYKHGYLMEIRDELDHDNFPFDQYTLLENYTNTEFDKLSNSLREMVEARGMIN